MTPNTQKTLFDEPEVSESFDGATFDKPLDGKRLAAQLSRVRALLSDGEWHTREEVRIASRGAESGATARIRDLRKARFGEWTIKSRRLRDDPSGGMWEYRWIRPEDHD